MRAAATSNLESRNGKTPGRRPGVFSYANAVSGKVRFGQLLERDRIGDPDEVLLDLDDAAPLPIAQAFVDAFARRPDDVAELSLRERDLRRRATFRVGLGRRYAQHRLGEARRQLEQRHLGDVLVGDAKPFAQDLDEPRPRLRMTLEEGQNLAPVEHREAALGERARVRGPPLAVEHGDFPEDLARM